MQANAESCPQTAPSTDHCQTARCQLRSHQRRWHPEARCGYLLEPPLPCRTLHSAAPVAALHPPALL